MSMLTAEDLRAIAARHAEVEADHAVTSNDYPLPYDRSQEHVDRGVLLAFVRAVAEMDPMHSVSTATCAHDDSMEDACFFCGGIVGTGHADGCLWLAAQGVKP